MNNITIFSNNDLGNIRSVTIDDTPWFMGRDICKMFGDKNANRSLSWVDDEDKMIIPLTDSLGRTQNAIFVNEAVCTRCCLQCSHKRRITIQEQMRTPSRCKRELRSCTGSNTG